MKRLNLFHDHTMRARTSPRQLAPAPIGCKQTDHYAQVERASSKTLQHPKRAQTTDNLRDKRRNSPQQNDPKQQKIIRRNKGDSLIANWKVLTPQHTCAQPPQHASRRAILPFDPLLGIGTADRVSSVS
jgi:hypothetical protein